MIIRLQLLQTPPSHSSSLLPSPKPTKTPFPNSNPTPYPKPCSLETLLKPSTTTTTDSGLKFHKKLSYLRALKVNTTKALTQNPNFRSTPLSSIKSVEICLSSMGIERSSLGRILDMHPHLLTADPYTDLYPILDFLLNEALIPFTDIRNSIVRCPRLLTSSVENQLRPTLHFLRELGFVGPNAITSHTTLLLVSSVEGTLIPKLDFLIGLGFEYREVANMVLRSPGLLTYSIENNYRPKVEYFLKEMNGDVREFKRFPQYFSFSLERKIKHRHRLLVENGFSLLPLKEMLKVSDGEFNAMLVEMRLRLVDQTQVVVS